MPIRRPKYLEFFTLNLTILPASQDTAEYYKRTIIQVFEQNLAINYGNDFYYLITELSAINDGEAFYVVMSKYLQLDRIDWVKSENGQKQPFEIPSNLEGRKGLYELIFYPASHKFAFVKRGKINPETHRKGAPLKAMSNILKMAFEQVVSEDKKVHVDIVQSAQIFDKIYSSQVLRLDLSLHYTNPSTNSEHEEFMDDLFRESHLGKVKMSLEPDASGSIDTSEKFVNGSLAIARENGDVKARLRTEEGIENINTKEHPEINGVEAENDTNIFGNFVSSIIDILRR